MMSHRPRPTRRPCLFCFLGLAAAITVGGCSATAAKPSSSVAGSTALGRPPSTTDPVSSSPTTLKARLKAPHRRPKPEQVKRVHTTTTLPPLGSAARGLVAGRVSIFGDSVTIDAAPDLESDIKGARVEAVVGEQWYQGVELAQTLRSEGELGAVAVVALGTNGPITSGDVAEMVHALAGVSRIVLVTDHVPTRYWQDPNNQIIRQAPRSYRNVVVADWAALGSEHPDWFYSDEVHMPIGGPGAEAMAALIASRI